MIVFHAQGGLGNQLFQYATARALAVKLDCPLVVDHHWYSHPLKGETPRVFQLKNYDTSFRLATEQELHQWTLLRSRWSRYAKPILPLAILNERYSRDKSLVLNASKNTYLKGFWQNEHYFRHIRDILLQELKPRVEPGAEDVFYLNKMENCNAVALHIRRGDYVSDARTAAFHGVCSLSYYEEAIAYFSRLIESPVFFVFSDDPEWAKDNLKIPFETFFVTHNDGTRAIQDLRLIAACRHHIIANSSFSWWGAWLADEGNQNVIAPKQWFQGSVEGASIVPPRWIQI